MEWTEVVDKAMGTVLDVLVPFLVLLVTYAIKKASDYLQERLDSDRLERAVQQIERDALNVVTGLEEDVRPMYEDRKLTAEERKAIKKMALVRLKNRLPQKAADRAVAVGSVALEEYLADVIERAHKDMKIRKKAAE